MQTASPALHSVGTGKGNILPFLRPFDFVAFALHEVDKIFFVQTSLHGVLDMIHQPELPTVTVLCGTILPGGELLAAAHIGLQHWEAVGLAELIAEGPQLFQRVGILPQFPAGLKVDRVDDEVRMDVRCIAVRGHQDLVSGPCAGRKLLRKRMRLPGREILLRGEGLDILVKVDTVQLPIGCFGRREFRNGVRDVTVDAADQPVL